MCKKNKRLYLFIRVLLFLIPSLCFGKINFTIKKNSIDQSDYSNKKKVSFKQHSLNIYAKHKKNKTSNHQPLLTTSGGDNASIWSNSFNFAKSGNSEVDPRTGTLLVSVKAGMLLSNFGHGPDIDLEMNYNSMAQGNPDHLGRGWAWNLTHYNPKTHQLNTSEGKSFFLKQQSDGRWIPQYHKLKDVIIISKNGHLEITSANGLRDILDRDGYETRLEQQNGDGVNFSYVSRSHILKKITDDQCHSIKLTMKDNYLTVTSYDVQGQPENIYISLENNEIHNILFPKTTHQQITDNSGVVSLSYGSGYYNQGLLTAIHYFTGMEKKFVYDCKHAMKLPVIPNFHNSFQSFKPVCVVKQVRMIPGTNQPPMIVNYSYTAINGNDHDYLGYNSSLAVMPGLKSDILFEAPASYTYKTKEDNRNVSIIRTYNKYHLLIDSKTINDKNNQTLNETQSYFCRTDKTDGCANTSFDKLPVTYSLPLKIVTKSWTENLSAPAMTTVQRCYDDNGRIISKTDAYGRETDIAYCPQHGDDHCPAAPDGWPVSSLTEQTTIFPAPANNIPSLASVITTMDYHKENNINGKGHILVLYKKTVKSGSTQRTETREYYQDNNNPLTYGLLKQKKLTGKNLPTGSVKTIIHHYQYTLNKNGTEMLSGYTDVANHQPVLSSTIEKSLFFPKTLRIISADKKNIKTFMYDVHGRLITRTDAAGSPFETTTHYKYKLSANENSVVITNSAGMQKKIIFDGSGRTLATYIEKTDLQGHLHPGLWQQQTQIRYNAEGEVAENTCYTDNGEGKGIPVALTTRFDYDALGRLTKKYLPDGETEVTQYDNAHRCIVSYTQDRQNHRTAVTISRSNVMGKPTEQIVLPATSGMLPSVTTLCIHGDQQSGAKISMMTYDGFDRLISAKDPMGRSVQYHYDAFGHVTDTIDPLGNKLHDVYGLTGHVIQHIAMPTKGGQYQLASASFNAAGQKLWSAGEDGSKTTYRYNINGQLSDTYKPNRHHIHLNYNITGLPVTDSLDDHVLLQVSYDHITHQPLTVTDNTGVTTYHYRDDGLPESVTHKGINGYPNSAYAFAYDSYDRLISCTDMHNNKTIYTVDRLGRPTGKKYQKNSSNTTQIDQLTYDSFSRIIKKLYGSGVIRMITYDSWSQVRTIKDMINKKLLYASSFVYDADGNITSLQRSDDQNHKVTINYRYDNLNSLVAMNCKGYNMLCPHDTALSNNNLKSAPVIIQQHYNFTPLNRIANVTEKLIDTSSSQSGSLSKKMTYSYSNIKVPLRLTAVSTQWNNQQPETHSLVYDIAGNMTTDGEGNEINYNPFSQITHVVNKEGVTSSYDYDGEGKEVRVMSPGCTRWMIYQEKSLNGEIVTDIENNMHYIGYPAAEIKTTDNTITGWYESNYKGDIIGVLKQDKTSGLWTVQEHKVYSPYGMVWSYDKNNTTIPALQQTLKGFNGELTDSVTGWQFLGAGHRTYNPAQRYFVSEDPAGDGYAFGSNNPIMNSDPSGNTPEWLGKIFSFVNTVSSLGLNRVHNKFVRGIGRSLSWVAMGLNLGPTFAFGMACTIPATLACSSAVKPANSGLQTAAMVTGITYTGVLFAAAILSMGAGLFETAAAAGAVAMADVAAGAGEEIELDAISSCNIAVESNATAETSMNPALSDVSESSEELSTSDSTESLVQLTESYSEEDEIAEHPESPDQVKRAVFGCGAIDTTGNRECCHSALGVDTFDGDKMKLPLFNADPANIGEVIKVAETGIYDEILQEYSPGNYMQSAHILLKPGGKFYVISDYATTDDFIKLYHLKRGERIFFNLNVIDTPDEIKKIMKSFGSRVFDRTFMCLAVFEKRVV